jgi:hypothetical protein
MDASLFRTSCRKMLPNRPERATEGWARSLARVQGTYAPWIALIELDEVS